MDHQRLEQQAFQAIKEQDADKLILLLNRRKACFWRVLSPDVCDEKGLSLLHYAAENGDNQSIRTLIQFKADINIVTNSYRASPKYKHTTPLYLAALNNKFETAKLLLKLGAKSNVGDRVPLVAAAECGNQSIVSLLLPLSDHLDRKSLDRYGLTPYISAQEAAEHWPLVAESIRQFKKTLLSQVSCT